MIQVSARKSLLSTVDCHEQLQRSNWGRQPLSTSLSWMSRSQSSPAPEALLKIPLILPLYSSKDILCGTVRFTFRYRAVPSTARYKLGTGRGAFSLGLESGQNNFSYFLQPKKPVLSPTRFRLLGLHSLIGFPAERIKRRPATQKLHNNKGLVYRIA